MPAAAIPAPMEYVKIVAVKKLVIGFVAGDRSAFWVCIWLSLDIVLKGMSVRIRVFQALS